MAEDETKKDETTDETAQDETSAAAGPAPEEGGSEAALGSSPEESAAGAEESEGRGTDAASASDPPSSESPAEDEGGAEQAPAEEAEAPATDKADAAESEPSEEDQLPWKERRRLQRSRRPHKPGPQRTVEERKAEREAVRKRKAEERRKERAAAKKDRTAGTGTPVAEKDSNAAKVRQGIVVSGKADKTITVRVDIVRRHPTYEKVIRRSRTLHAHDERNEAGEGDTVRVVETRPMSKTKRWRLVEVLEKAK